MTDLQKIEADFNTTLVKGSIKGAMKAAGAGSRDLWQVDPFKIRIIEGLNPRVMTPTYEAHIRSLADSMKTEGYYQDQPMAGYAAVVDGEQVIFIYAGHTRLLAVKLAISEGADIPRVPVSVNQDGLSMEDITVALIRGNGGKRLTPYEDAIVCKRLVRYGYSTTEIAHRVGFSKQHVENLLTLMEAPFKLREMVAHEKVAASLAIEMIIEHGDKALQKLEEALLKANKEGKSRVTAKHVAGATFQKVVKKSAPVMYSALEEIKADPGFGGLSDSVRQKLEDLLADISKSKGDSTEVDERQNALFSDQQSETA